MRIAVCASLILALAPIAAPAQASGDFGPIQIVSGVFGKLGRQAKLDIAAPLQKICGPGAMTCQVFCSETSFGRYRLGSKPICRVTYRCGTAETRTVEAAREEPIFMRCRDPEDERPVAATAY